MAPDLVMSGNKIDWDTSADTFSLGITLYELLAHIYPWSGSNPCPKTAVDPIDIRKYNDKLTDAFADFVMKAIKTDRNKRFPSAKEMLDALNAIGPDGILKDTNRLIVTIKDEYSDIVDYINSLYSQSIHGNAGTRVGAKEQIFDQLTYTQTKLDKKLIGDIKEGKYKLIIITGNAGDGKTAFIRKVEGQDPNRTALPNRNGAKFTLNGIPFISNYDGSQDEEERANDEVLAEFFKPFYHLPQYDHLSEGRIIAINEGRLIDFLHSQPALRQLDDNIEDYFYREGHVELLPGLMVINLNLRSVTARGEDDTPSLLAQQIKAITQPELWTKCQGCPVADRCYIRYNVETFQDSTSGDAVISRLEWLLRTIVYKRELHITMRDLRSMIAFMLTRDYSCEQVKKLIEYVATEGLEEYYWQYYYFNITASNITPNAYFPFPTLESNDRLIRLLRETDIARVALPSFDRDLYFRNKRPEDYLIFTDRNQSLLNSFNQYASQMPGWEHDKKLKQIIEIRHHCYIRHQYFEGQFDYQLRLPYRHITNFADLMKTNDLSKLDETKEALAEAISNSEGCFNKEIQKHHLLLAGSHTKDPSLDPHCDCYAQTYTLNDELINFIKDHNRAGKPAGYIADIQKAIVDFLTGESSMRPMKEKTSILDYDIIEVLQTTETFTEYLCQPKYFVDKRYKVREYPLDFADKSPMELETIRNRAENARHAQEKLDPCPYIVKCNCHLNDAHTVFYEISDYIEECTLRAKLRQKTFTQLEKLHIILDIARALKEAHSKNVFHRDVCPENIYLLNSGTAALANFGHSWFSEHSDMHYTVASILPDENSPYTPPEFADDDVSSSSDLYSLGVIFYELLTDKLPFQSTSTFRTLGLFPDNLLPSHIVKDLPEWTDDVVRHTITLDQDQRWQEADELIDFIESHLESQNKTTPPNTTYLKDLKSGDNITPELVLYEELGKGGFGRVFKAKHLIQNKFYAVKVFDKDASVSETINEFKALEDLKHDNIVKFVYNGKSNQGLFYTLMELLDGENLGSYTKGDLRLPITEIYKMLQQILSALVFMQAKVPPVYHRDIKPNNIVWGIKVRNYRQLCLCR